MPILFLSARDDEIDRVLGLEIGGDDYVTKPFSPRETGRAGQRHPAPRGRAPAQDEGRAMPASRGALTLSTRAACRRVCRPPASR